MSRGLRTALYALTLAVGILIGYLSAIESAHDAGYTMASRSFERAFSDGHDLFKHGNVLFSRLHDDVYRVQLLRQSGSVARRAQ